MLEAACHPRKFTFLQGFDKQQSCKAFLHLNRPASSLGTGMDGGEQWGKLQFFHGCRNVMRR